MSSTADRTPRPFGPAAVLWTAYLVVLPFHRMWSLPWFGTKLQPPELILIALAGTAAVRWLRGQARWIPAPGDATAVLWLVACVAGVITLDGHLRFSDPKALAEALGGVSLVGLYAAVRLTADDDLLATYPRRFATAAAVAAALGLVGAGLAWWGVPTRLATTVMTLVPYLQFAPRAQAFTAGPQMLASLLLLAVPLFIASRGERGWRRTDRILLALLVAGLTATLSKTALCLAPALAVMVAVRSTRGRALAAAAVWLATTAVFVGGSHLMVVRSSESAVWRIGQVVAGEPLGTFAWRGTSWDVMPTTYVQNKRASLMAIRASWPRGIGPAQQPAFTAGRQHDGLLPATMVPPYTTPHSTYLGTVAEYGALGLAGLAALLITAWMAVRRMIDDSAVPRAVAGAFAGAAAAFVIEAVSTDLMNCRHYWFLFAVMTSVAAARARVRVRA